MDPFNEQVRSAEHGGKNYSTQISNEGTQADLKMYKTSKMKYLQIHKFPIKNVILLTIDGFHSDVIKL